jgi:pimeloyl-ACP methyl ester carboxylesterase
VQEVAVPYATNAGVRVYYETEGKGPPLVLHTGFTGALQDWRDFGYVDALHDDFRLILIDPRGHGARDKPHDPAAYEYAPRIADLTAVLDAEGVERAHFWGYSMGGAMGFATAVYAPHRLRSLVSGGPSMNAMPTDPQAAIQWAAGVRAGGNAAVVTIWESELGSLPASVRARLLSNDIEALAAHCLLGQPSDLLERLSRIALPTLIYCGDRDGGYAGLEAVTERIPEARFVGLKDMNHLQTFRQSDAILPHVRAFLTDVEHRGGTLT